MESGKAIEEKKIIKVVDLLGRKTNQKSASQLIYIYNDGSIERKIILK